MISLAMLVARLEIRDRKGARPLPLNNNSSDLQLPGLSVLTNF